MKAHETYYGTIPSYRVTKDEKFISSSMAPPPTLQSIRNRRFLLMCLVSFLFVGMIIVEWLRHSSTFGHSILRPLGSFHSTVIPTLLSIVDPDTNAFVFALDNPVYESLGQIQARLYRPTTKRFQNGNDNSSEASFPTLTIDRTTAEYASPMTVSWTKGHGSFAVRDESSVIVLICFPFRSKNKNNNNDYLNNNTIQPVLVEAATIAQAVATSKWHENNEGRNAGYVAASNPDDWDHWFIPRLPTLRYESCRFQLYSYEDGNNDNSPERKYLSPSKTAKEEAMTTWYLMAQSPRFTLIHRPTAIHLALTGNPSEMLISFVSISDGDENVEQVRVGIPIVHLVDQDGQDVQVFEGTTISYTALDLCQGPANETSPGKFQPPGSLHSVLITNLQQNTRYRYRVGVKGGQGAVLSSDVYEFTSALPVGDPQPFAYIVYGDQGCPSVGWGMGGLWTSAMVSREILQPQQYHLKENGLFTWTNMTSERELAAGASSYAVRAVHHFGDLSYARGAAHIWDEWFRMIQVFTTQVPLMISVGNHEYDHTAGGENGKDPSGLTTSHGFMPSWGNFGEDSGGECGVPTAKRFTMPNNENTNNNSPIKSNGVFWYSYNFGSVHTIVVSSEHDLGRESPQHVWLELDLISVNRSVTPWVVLEIHRPLYENEALWDQNTVGIGMRYEMEDLLCLYNVDLVLAGHYHAYHRSCDKLYRSKCNNGGPMHITVGTAGAQLASNFAYSNGWTDKSILGEYGYGRITIENASALHFEFVKAGDVNDTSAGEILDEVWLIRRR